MRKLTKTLSIISLTTLIFIISSTSVLGNPGGVGVEPETKVNLVKASLSDSTNSNTVLGNPGGSVVDPHAQFKPVKASLSDTTNSNTVLGSPGGSGVEPE